MAPRAVAVRAMLAAAARAMLATVLGASVVACSAPRGGPPPPFKPPIASPVEKQPPAATVARPHDNGCFGIEREPGDAGGLRIPAQVVCPPWMPGSRP